MVSRSLFCCYNFASRFCCSSLLWRRTAMILGLLCALQGSFLLENPATSVLLLHPRLRFILGRMKEAGCPAPHSQVCLRTLLFLPTRRATKHAEAFKVTFWMRHYKSPSMKRTMVISNQRICGMLDKGQLFKNKKKKAIPTTKRYLNAEGRRRFCGTSQLKQSQKLSCSKPDSNIWVHCWEAEHVLHLREYSARFARAIACMVPDMKRKPPNFLGHAPRLR